MADTGGGAGPVGWMQQAAPILQRAIGGPNDVTKGLWRVLRPAAQRYLDITGVRGQGGTVTPLPGARPPPSTPPPASSTPPINPNYPGGVRGEVARQGAVLAAWVTGNAAYDWWARKQAAEKAKAKKKKQQEEAARKKREAEQRRRDAEAKRRAEILYRTQYGRAPPTPGRGPITGPRSGNRQYDLPRNPAVPPKPGRTQVDVYVHPDAAPQAPTARDIYREANIDPFLGQVVRARSLPELKLPGQYGKVDPRMQPYKLPKSAPSPWGRARAAYGTASAAYGKYGKYIGAATLLYPYLAPKSQPKKRAAPSESPLTPPNVGAVEFPQAWPQAQLAPQTASKCKCPSNKRKKRGPRKLRTVCYKGSYTETAKGTSKRKREQIPCRA